MNNTEYKTKELIGKEAYYKLLENGLITIEINQLKVLLNTKDEIKKINEKLSNMNSL